MARSNIKQVFDNLRKNCYNAAQRRMTEGLPAAMEVIYAYAQQKMEELDKSSMTGNYINGFGIAIYRDGEFIACATSADVGSDSPIQVTLASGDVFQKGRQRYDGSEQKHTFKASVGTHRIFANEEVVRWLRRYRPRASKGKSSLAYRIVNVVDYSKLLGCDRVLLQLADSVESRGGTIKEFKFA